MNEFISVTVKHVCSISSEDSLGDSERENLLHTSGFGIRATRLSLCLTSKNLERTPLTPLLFISGINAVSTHETSSYLARLFTKTTKDVAQRPTEVSAASSGGGSYPAQNYSNISQGLLPG